MPDRPVSEIGFYLRDGAFYVEVQRPTSLLFRR